MKLRRPFCQGLLLLVAVIFFSILSCRLAAPVVSNVRASQRAGTQVVDFYYDLTDSDSSALTLTVAVSTSGAAAYFSP